MTAHFKFDWYGASILSDPEGLKSLIKERDVDAVFCKGKKLGRYSESYLVEPYGVHVKWGDGNEFPYSAATGSKAPAWSELLRSGIAHRTSRVDVAFDTRELTYEELYHRINELVPSRLRVTEQGDPDRTRASTSRTCYFGSPTSVARICLYEKGLEQQQVFNRQVEDSPSDWMRVELRIRTEKDLRVRATTMRPEEFFGVCKWTKQVGESLGALCPYVPIDKTKNPALDAFSHMRSQYSNVVQEVERQLGTERTAELLLQMLSGRIDAHCPHCGSVL